MASFWSRGSSGSYGVCYEATAPTVHSLQRKVDSRAVRRRRDPAQADSCGSRAAQPACGGVCRAVWPRPRSPALCGAATGRLQNHADSWALFSDVVLLGRHFVRAPLLVLLLRHSAEAQVRVIPYLREDAVTQQQK